MEDSTVYISGGKRRCREIDKDFYDSLVSTKEGGGVVGIVPVVVTLVDRHLGRWFPVDDLKGCEPHNLRTSQPNAFSSPFFTSSLSLSLSLFYLKQTELHRPPRMIN